MKLVDESNNRINKTGRNLAITWLGLVASYLIALTIVHQIWWIPITLVILAAAVATVVSVCAILDHYGYME